MAETKTVQHIPYSTSSGTLADVLELVLEKGVVIAGDIQIKIADVELLTIKIRLLIAGVDTAKKMGIDWWEHDSYLSTKAKEAKEEEEKEKLERRIKELEAKVVKEGQVK